MRDRARSDARLSAATRDAATAVSQRRHPDRETMVIRVVA